MRFSHPMLFFIGLTDEKKLSSFDEIINKTNSEVFIHNNRKIIKYNTHYFCYESVNGLHQNLKKNISSFYTFKDGEYIKTFTGKLA